MSGLVSKRYSKFDTYFILESIEKIIDWSSEFIGHAVGFIVLFRMFEKGTEDNYANDYFYF
jgi:hypothetical protein